MGGCAGLSMMPPALSLGGSQRSAAFKLEAREALLQPDGSDTLGSSVNTAGGSVAALMANLLP